MKNEDRYKTMSLSIASGRSPGAGPIRVWITSYDEPEHLQLCVRSWLRYSSFPLTVVDNFSSEDTAKAVQALASERVRVILLPTNTGHSAAMELAKNEATEERIIFCDQDVEVLAPITEAEIPKAAIAGVPVFAFVDPVCGYLTVTRFHTSFLLVRRDLIENMRPAFLPYETGHIYYDTGAVLYHTLKPKASLDLALQNKFVHYSTHSKKTFVTNAPADIKSYISLARRVTHDRLNGLPTSTDEIRRTYTNLWAKYCKPWRVERPVGGERNWPSSSEASK